MFHLFSSKVLIFFLLKSKYLMSGLKRTNSIQVNEPNKTEDKLFSSAIQQNKQIAREEIELSNIVSDKGKRNSQILHSSFYKSRMKLPEAVRESILQQASGNRPSITKSKFGKAMLDKMIGQMFVCGICECEYKMKEKVVFGKCGHFFCDSCLQHYAIYKVGRFQEILCPDDKCEEALASESDFFKSLPAEVRKKYEKIATFFKVAKDPNLRLCPNQKCENGTLELAQGIDPICNSCGQTFCSKCMFPAHSGPCEKNEVDFFVGNLHYRQCRRCKNVIQRNQGCNHMTCRCGHQFCYICGKDWKGYDHLCNENEQVHDEQMTVPCLECCVCCQMDECCGLFCKGIVKICFGIPIFLFIFSLKFALTLLVNVTMIAVTIFLGCTGFTCEVLCDQDNCCVTLIAFIFLPMTMLVGIFIAFKEFYCEFFQAFNGQECETYAALCECLILW